MYNIQIQFLTPINPCGILSLSRGNKKKIKKPLDKSQNLWYNELTNKGRKTLQTRKGIIMKKSTMQSLINYLNGATVSNVDEIRAELEKELNRGAEKAAANRALYDSARDVVLRYLNDEPITTAALYDLIKDELPTGFGLSKLQYGMRVWSEAGIVTKTEDSRPATYVAAQ